MENNTARAEEKFGDTIPRAEEISDSQWHTPILSRKRTCLPGKKPHCARPHFVRVFHAFRLPCRVSAAIVPAAAGPILRSQEFNSNTLEKEI